MRQHYFFCYLKCSKTWSIYYINWYKNIVTGWLVMFLNIYSKIFISVLFPANICWSSTGLQHNFSSSRAPWKTKIYYAEDVFKTSWRHILKTPWRSLEGMSSRSLENVLEKTKCLLGISVSNHGLLTNLNQYLTNLYLTNLYFAFLRRIQNTFVRTH